MKILITFIALLLIGLLSGHTQDLPLSSFNGYHYLRDQQVAGRLDPNFNFSFRANNDSSIFSGGKAVMENGSFQLLALPIILTADYYSSHPIASLNGSMPPSGGLSTQYSLGVFAQWENLSFQLRPEWNLVPNNSYPGFPETASSLIWANQYNWWNQIDLPKVSSTAVNQLLLGQSYLSFDWKVFRIKASSENIQWGPGKYDALTLSNNAAGFNHLSLQSNQPINIGIGTLSFQWYAGQLLNSGGYPPDTAKFDRGSRLYEMKPRDKRYITGHLISYLPKWVEGLTIGYANTIQQYESSTSLFDRLGSISSSFMVFEGAQGLVFKQQIETLFFRWFWAASNAEVYAEVIKENPQRIFDNWLFTPANNRAWLLGFSKFWPTQTNQGWLVDVELTQLQQTVDWALSNGPGVYLDENIRQGYTHKGESLGSSLMPGSNRQTLALKYLHNEKRYGMLFQRIANNNDFYYFHFSHNRDFRRYWVDVLIGLNIFTPIQEKIWLNAQVNYIYSINYQWEHDLDPDKRYFAPGNDIEQFQAKLSLHYQF